MLRQNTGGVERTGRERASCYFIKTKTHQRVMVQVLYPKGMARFVKKIWDSRLLQSRDASSHLGMNLSASSHLGMHLDLPLIWVHRFVHFAFGYHVAFGYMVRLGTLDFPPRPLFAHTHFHGLGMCFAHGPKGNLSFEGYTHLSNSGRASHFEHTQKKFFGHYLGTSLSVSKFPFEHAQCLRSASTTR